PVQTWTPPTNLVVFHLDDDPFEIEAIRRVLSSEKAATFFILESFLDTASLNERLSDKKVPGVDVFLLDIHLGDEGDASALLHDIKRRFPTSTVVMCSGRDDFATVKQYLRDGADDFISKKADGEGADIRI